MELVEEFGEAGNSLAFFLGSCLIEAIDDWAARAGGPPVDLYERFLGWCTA